MLLITENAKSNLKNVKRKVYESRIENKKFSRVLQIKHEKYIHIKMTNIIETSIAFAFPVYYSRISMVGFVLELCSALEVESRLQVVSPTKETYIYLYRKYFTEKRKCEQLFFLLCPIEKIVFLFERDRRDGFPFALLFLSNLRHLFGSMTRARYSCLINDVDGFVFDHSPV